MDAKEINERVVALKQDRERMIANINAIDGALQDCAYWFDKLEKTAEVPVVGKSAKEKA